MSSAEEQQQQQQRMHQRVQQTLDRTTLASRERIKVLHNLTNTTRSHACFLGDDDDDDDSLCRFLRLQRWLDRVSRRQPGPAVSAAPPPPYYRQGVFEGTHLKRRLLPPTATSSSSSSSA
jgi:hypothetical protein